jgi:hypothetical protein
MRDSEGENMLGTKCGVASLMAVLFLCGCSGEAANQAPTSAGSAKPSDPASAKAIETWAIGATVVYKGAFSDEAGHKGPLTCDLTRVDQTVWHAAFSAANEGKGPNRPFTRDANLTGRRQGRAFVFSGEVFMKAGGPYVLRAVLSPDNRLTAKYERKAGGWAGTFELNSPLKK